VGDLDDAESQAVCLGDGRWILLEPRPGPLSESLETAVDRLAGRGFHSLIAHPERHMAADMFQRLTRVVQRGALVQATAAFFEGGPAADGMFELAGRGLVHVHERGALLARRAGGIDRRRPTGTAQRRAGRRASSHRWRPECRC
jgi:hypothetical protein